MVIRLLYDAESPKDGRTKLPENQATRGPRHQRTRGLGDSKTRGCEKGEDFAPVQDL